MSLNFPNGAGQLLGDRLVTGTDLTMLGAADVFYVGPTNASDADTGKDPLRPFATVGQGQTAGGTDSIIVLMDGLVISSNLTITKKLIFAAGGQNNGQPTVTWQNSGSISVTVDDVEFRNIKFIAPGEASSGPRFIITGADCLFRGCRFEMNGNDASTAIVRLDSGGNRCRFESCVFVVTSTSVSARPPAAIRSNHAAVTHVFVRDCTFDGGTTGFDTTGSGVGRNGEAINFGGFACKWKLENLTLLRGPDIGAEPGSTSGFVQVSTNTGSSKVYT